MRKLSRVFVAVSALLASGCVTAPSKPEYEPARVVERIGGKDEAPEWASGEVAMSEEGGDVIFLNQMSMSGDSRSEACLKAAETDGRASMKRYIKDNIVTSGQVNETDAKSDPGYESLTAFLSKGSLSGVKVHGRYWEKREESAESGERVLRIRCVVRLGIKKGALEQQLREAMTAPGGNAKVREALLNGTTQFLEGLTGDANPASAESAVGH